MSMTVNGAVTCVTESEPRIIWGGVRERNRTQNGNEVDGAVCPNTITENSVK